MYTMSVHRTEFYLKNWNDFIIFVRNESEINRTIEHGTGTVSIVPAFVCFQYRLYKYNMDAKLQFGI